jgi:hypothetical protein
MSDDKDRWVFPRWLRRWDATLEGAGDNNLFQLFSMRRKEHGSRGILGCVSRWWKQVDLRSILWGILAIFIVFVLMYLLTCCGLILAFGIFAVFKKFHRQRRIKEKIMPFSVSDVFITHGIVESVALDLWQAGFSGREVVEAIYLEKRRKEWVVTLLFSSVTLLFIAGLYLWLRGPVSVVKVLTLASFFWLSWESIRRSVVNRPKNIGKTLLHPLLYQWANITGAPGYGAAFGKGAGKAFLKVATWIIVLVVFQFLMAFLLMGNSPGISINQGVLAYIIPDSSYIIDIMCGTTFFMVSLFLLKSHKNCQKKNVQLFDDLLDKSDFSFNSFMTFTITQDVDGARWAQWFYKWFLLDGKFMKFTPTTHIYHWDISPDLTKLLIHQENIKPHATSESWITWKQFPISILLMKEITTFLEWYEKLHFQSPESRDEKELEEFFLSEKELMEKLRSHLGPNYNIVFNKSILKNEDPEISEQ